MKYARIYTKIWQDERFADLDPLDKLVFLYLISNPLNNGIGLYHLRYEYIAIDLGISRQKAIYILEKLQKKGLIAWDRENRLVLIKNYIKYNYNLNNPKHVQAIYQTIKEYQKFPLAKVLKDYVDSLIQIKNNEKKEEEKKEEKRESDFEKLSQKGKMVYYEIFKNVVKEKRKITVPPSRYVEGQCEYIHKFLELNKIAKKDRLVFFKKICEKYVEFPKEKYLFGDLLRNIQYLFKEVLAEEQRKKTPLTIKKEKEEEKIDLERIEKELEEMDKEKRNALIEQAKKEIALVLNMVSDKQAQKNLILAKCYEILKKRIKGGLKNG